MAEDDHFITNDPWLSSGHLHDITVVTPTFRRGELIALFACCCHQVDIGGLGQGPDATSVFEEGLYIPVMYLARKGELAKALDEKPDHMPFRLGGIKDTCRMISDGLGKRRYPYHY